MADKLLQDIIAWAQSQLEIIALYLFGSYAEGRAHHLSDLDIAILARQDLPYEKLWRLEDRWAACWPEQVDLHILNLAPIPVRFEIIRRGQRLWCSDDTATVVFESLTRRRYWDLQPLLEESWRRWRQDLEEKRDAIEREQYQTALEQIRAVHHRVRTAAATQF